MNRVKWWIAAAVCAALNAGCGQSAGGNSAYVPKSTKSLTSALLPESQETNYFPMAEGNQWTFESSAQEQLEGQPSQSGNMDVTYRCVKVAPAPKGGVDGTLEVWNNDSLLTKQIWRIDKSGIYQVAIGKKLNYFNTPQPVVLFPIKVGSTFDWKGTINSDTGEPQEMTNTGKVLGEEEADTAMGPNNALAVTSEGKLSSSKGTSTLSSKLWLIPNMGIGRFIQESVATIKVTNPKTNKTQTVRRHRLDVMKLKNFSRKK
jgi:hypothetical protein